MRNLAGKGQNLPGPFFTWGCEKRGVINMEKGHATTFPQPLKTIRKKKTITPQYRRIQPVFLTVFTGVFTPLWTQQTLEKPQQSPLSTAPENDFPDPKIMFFPGSLPSSCRHKKEKSSNHHCPIPKKCFSRPKNHCFPGQPAKQL